MHKSVQTSTLFNFRPVNPSGEERAPEAIAVNPNYVQNIHEVLVAALVLGGHDARSARGAAALPRAALHQAAQEPRNEAGTSIPIPCLAGDPPGSRGGCGVGYPCPSNGARTTGRGRGSKRRIHGSSRAFDRNADY